MTTKLIEVVHSTYGVVKLSVEKSDYNTLLFRRENGDLVGEMDETSGGMIFKHPNTDVAKFLEELDNDLIEVDERGYIELEDKLYDAADEAFPGFFKKEEKDVLKSIPFEKKSQIVMDMANKLGLKIEKLTVAECEPEDLAGIPRKG